MSDRHELFDELEAFHPLWFKVYHNLFEAVDACVAETPYVRDIYLDFIGSDQGHRYLAQMDGVPDTKRAIEEMQKAEEESSLPFKLNDIGKARRVE